MTSSRFDIKKFCEGNSCPRVSYNKVATGGNDPTMSTKMRYAQYVRGQKTRAVVTIVPSTFVVDKNVPYYRFALTQTQSTIR
jgi:hypothetical protein|tara:strand:- start:638 stop:883 length:246 start_codon:yes stop_codon:yes gene_type:complete